MNSKPNADWLLGQDQIEEELRRRGARGHVVKLVPLEHLVKYHVLPLHQQLPGLDHVPVSDLRAEGHLNVFVSHRWVNEKTPDDGTLIEAIFRFCLGVILRNNFSNFSQVKHLHHSSSLSARITATIPTLDPERVATAKRTFGRYDALLDQCSETDTMRNVLAELLSRFRFWIDYCSLPQEVLHGGQLQRRTDTEEREFELGLSVMDLLVEEMETLIHWRPSEVERAWLYLEALCSIPRGQASFAMPMELIADLSTIVRQHHLLWANMTYTSSTMILDTLHKSGIRATHLRDIECIAGLLEHGLRFSKWNFRIVQ